MPEVGKSEARVRAKGASRTAGREGKRGAERGQRCGVREKGKKGKRGRRVRVRRDDGVCALTESEASLAIAG